MASKAVAHRIDKKWRSEDVKLQEVADFTSLLLTDSVLVGLEKAGFKTPSPIQLEAIPVGRFGKDLVVQAKSGTGKTLVFTVVALEMLLDVKHPQVLILAPTREIAFQICSVIQAVGSQFKELKCCTFIGGTSINEDKNQAHHCQIAVGTPGRIKQLTDLGILKTNSIRLFVLDEADQLLADSFRNDVDDIFLTLPKDKQVIATSATYPKKLKKLVDRYFRKPFLARLSVDELALLGIIHYTYLVDTTDLVVLAYKQKLKCLERILTTVAFSQCLVFCNMISRVQQLSSDIKKWGFSTAYISSAKEQSERLKAIDKLKRFKCKVLVSSDLTARGIDAENVDLVINFDVPNYTDVYLHRSGRAGRYGSKGVSITFVNEKELKAFKSVEGGGNFKSYALPIPIPENLINIRPQEFFEKAVIEEISSDSSEDSSEEENDEDSIDKANEDDIVKANEGNIDKDNEAIPKINNPQMSVPNGVSKSGMEESIIQNADSNLSHFEVKLPCIETNPESLLPKNLVELPNSSTSAISQSCSEEHIKPGANYEEIFALVGRTFRMEGSKSKKIGEINNAKVAAKEVKGKFNPEDKKGDGCKTMKDSSIKNESFETNESLSSPNFEHTKESGDENFRDMHSAISNFIVHHEKNFDNTLAKDLSSKCNKDSQDVPSNDVITDESSYIKFISTKDIIQLRNGLNNYYYTVFKSYTDECTASNPQINVTKKEVETDNSNIPVEKIQTNNKTLLQKQPNTNFVDEYDSDEETESSSEIESYLENTSVPKKSEVIFVSKATDESSGSSSSDCKASSSQVLSKKLSQSNEEAEFTSGIQSSNESTPKRKGEVIYTAKLSDDSSGNSDLSDSEPLESVLSLNRKFKELVQDSYKKHPPKNGGMPKLPKSICKQFSQSTDVAQGAVFIGSSGSSTKSKTSREASSESSIEVDTYEIQRPTQRRGQNTSSTHSMSSNTSKHSRKPDPKPRGSKKSQSSLKERRNSTKSNDVSQNNSHCGRNSVSRLSDRGTCNVGQSTNFKDSQYANPHNWDVNDSRSNWETYNARHENLQSTSYMGNSHCNSQPVNQQSYNCTRACPNQGRVPRENLHITNYAGNSHCYSQPVNQQSNYTQACPNQGHLPNESLNYQSHLYNQWYETFQKQWQCIHNSIYFL